jgi:O-antigen/teichoic acid export membrane protein
MLVTGRVVSAACGLVQVPFALSALGTERFGVWVALVSLIWTAGSLDAGVGFAVQNRIATLLATGREEEAAATGRRGLALLWGVAAVLALLSVGLVIGGDWCQWLGLTDAMQAAEIRPAVAVALGAATLSVPLSFATRLAAARQQTWLTGAWTALASLGGLGAVIGASALRLPLVGFMVAACILPVGPHLGTWLHLRWRREWLGRARGPAPRDRDLWRESVAFFIPQLGAAFVGAFVPMLVALIAGPAAAATYGVLQRLFGLALQLQSLVLQPTWPLYTQATARHDATAARQLFRTSMFGTLAGAGCVLLLLAPLTPSILRVWLGSNAPLVTATVLWAVAGWHALQFLGQPPAMLLNGAGRPGVVAISTVASIAATLALCHRLGAAHGTAGLMAALAAPYVLLNLPVVYVAAVRTLRSMRDRPAPA